MTDAGSTSVSDPMRAAFAALGIEHRTEPASRPMLRTMIERLFRSQIDGPSGPIGTVEADQDSAELREALTPDERFHAFTVRAAETYNNAPQEALGGETPAARFRRLAETYPLRALPCPQEMWLAFGIDVRRRTGARGVRVLGLYFQGHELQEYRATYGDRPIIVRVDEMNLGEVSALLDGRWVSLRCAMPGLDGITARGWIAAIAAVRRQQVQTRKEQAEETAKLLHDGISVESARFGRMATASSSKR